jgi:hypothetical protein
MNLHGDGNKIYMCVLDPDGSKEHHVTTRKLELLNRWLHLAFVCDGRWILLTKAITVYRNYQSDKTAAAWQATRDAVAIGYGGGLVGVVNGYSYIRELLTLDFDNEPK